MKKLFLILLNFYFLSVFAQKFPVEGHVTDTSGQSVPFAAVRLLQHNIIKTYTVADTAGLFRLENVPAGSYMLIVTQAGYHDYQQSITINRPVKNLDIRLRPQAENLQTVEINVLRTVEIRSGGVRLNVAGTSLANEPDLTHVLRYAPNITFINGLQVLGSNRIILRIDGRKIEAGADKIADYLQRLKPENIRYIEIRDAGDAETAGDQAAEIIIRTTKTLGISLIPYARAFYRSALAYNGGSEMYHVKGRFRYWVNFFLEHGPSFSNEYRQTFLDNDITYTDTSHTSLIRHNFGLTLGTDFYQNDRTTIGFFYDYYSDADIPTPIKILTKKAVPISKRLIGPTRSYNLPPGLIISTASIYGMCIMKNIPTPWTPIGALPPNISGRVFKVRDKRPKIFIRTTLWPLDTSMITVPIVATIFMAANGLEKKIRPAVSHGKPALNLRAPFG